MLSASQMIVAGLLLWLGSIIWLLIQNRNNPLYEEPLLWLSLDKWWKLISTTQLGWVLILIGCFYLTFRSK